MLSYPSSLKIVNEHLSNIFKRQEPAELYDPIYYLISVGGKRIRPCLAIMSFSMFSDDIKPVLDPAIGLEVFHNFTLMHDDIMDNASVRRNFETVHVKWNRNVAILSGDAMLILAYQLMTKTRQEAALQVLSLFSRTALEVCEGQQYDMNFETKSEVRIGEYLEMIRLKTAVLLAASLAMGGIIAGARPKEYEALYNLGLNIGIAFQLQDDYLDIFAEGDKFGKSIGNDILANKKTFLLLSALQCEEKDIIAELNDWISRKKFDANEKIQAFKRIYEKLELREKTLNLSQEYFNKGFNFLKQVDVPEKNKTELTNLINLLIKREH
jgi:geranylgeranyl diphosphate synthase, type II